ncbi:MAG: tetratricopeptide repeat protein [Rhodopila sp.]|jgi:tetratricopeptide (TPR) repeat protein
MKPLFEQGFRAALAHVNAGNLAAAAAACIEIRRDRPDDPAVLQLHATIALRTGNPQEALDSIRRSLAARPGHVPSLILAARAAIAAGTPEHALPPLHEAVARAPHLPEPAFLLCRTLLDLNHPSLNAMLNLTAARHPSQAAEWQQLGLALQRAQRPTDALTAFTRASEADPTLSQAHFGRGLLLRDAGRMTEARTALHRAVTLDPTAAGAWFALGLTHQDLHDETAAATAFQAALRERPSFAEAAVNLGIALQRLGNIPAAMEAYRNAVQIRPDTFGRIAQAITAARTGMLWLDPAAFRRALGA